MDERPEPSPPPAEMHSGELPPGERPASEYPPDDRRGTAWFGLPAMLAVAGFAALGKAVGGLGGLIVGAFVAFLIMLIIGFAMTVAKRL